MSLPKQEITQVRVINIIEESAKAIEQMVNRAIQEIQDQGLQILDIQTTEDNIFLIIGGTKPKS